MKKDLLTMENQQIDLSDQQLWNLNIRKLEGHNIEAKGREEVNKLLKKGWTLLHIYTLRYKQNGTWRERPMAILGRPKRTRKQAILQAIPNFSNLS